MLLTDTGELGLARLTLTVLQAGDVGMQSPVVFNSPGSTKLL